MAMTKKAHDDIQARQADGYALVDMYENKRVQIERMIYIRPDTTKSGDIITITHVFNGKQVVSTTIDRFTVEKALAVEFDRAQQMKEAV
jgi:hypothetical protein